MVFLGYTEELINVSIDSYNILNKNQKSLLKALIKISTNNKVVSGVKELSNLIGVTNTTVSSALSVLEGNKIIQDITRRGIIFTGCVINKSKIDEIITYYQTKKTFLEKI